MAEENAASQPTHAACESDGMPEEELLYDLADLFKVFSDTTRIKILYALMSDELSVNDLAEAIGTSQSAVSHQLRILERKSHHGPSSADDGRNIHYSLADDHVLTILDQGLTHIMRVKPTPTTAPAGATH